MSAAGAHVHRFPLLAEADSPADLRAVPEERLGELAAEIRAFLVEKVCATGGHLGPNLGVVELTIALHRVFDSPRDTIVFDTGHQAYAHKLLTGRRKDFGVSAGSSGRSWTAVFADELTAVAAEHPEVVAVTASMLRPTGLHRMWEKFPDRVFDVGIAEQHAVTSAAGLAMGGLHPVVALYATFLGRAFDQVLMDVALHGLPVTFVLDRAGITGPDGPSHHGIWDLAVLGTVPGMRVAVPRDAAQLRELLTEAVTHSSEYPVETR